MIANGAVAHIFACLLSEPLRAFVSGASSLLYSPLLVGWDLESALEIAPVCGQGPVTLTVGAVACGNFEVPCWVPLSPEASSGSDSSPRFHSPFPLEVAVLLRILHSS